MNECLYVIQVRNSGAWGTFHWASREYNTVAEADEVVVRVAPHFKEVRILEKTINYTVVPGEPCGLGTMST